MNSRTIIVAVVSLAIGAVVGVLGFTWIVGGSGEPSTDTVAPTIDVNAVATLSPDEAFEAQTQVAELSAENEELQATIAAYEEAAAAEPTEEPMDEATEEMAEPTEEVEAMEATEEVEEAAGGRNLYRIESETSEVTFVLQEDLRGERIDVIGTTNEVAGDILIDMSNPSASTVGTIVINARTLETDNRFRNGALRSEILLASQDQYEFIEFVPTEITGLPESIEIGETYTFDVTGDLTITGVTNEVTFTVEATLESEEELVGTASAVVLWADWNISIPSAPGVANITDEVTLTIDFTAPVVTE